MMISKKIIVVFLAAAILVVSLVFREKISRLLSLRRGAAPAAEPLSLPASIAAPSVPNHPAEGSKTPPAVAEKDKTPVYAGREPGEVRPVPEEVKLFSEDQREHLYANIEKDAEMVRRTPTFFEGWIHLGILKKVIGDFEGARDAWEFAGVIEPLNSTSFSNLGELYWRYLHDYSRAEANFKISIKHKPDSLIYISLADLYHYSYKEKYNEAPKILLDGLAANPTEENLMRHLAYIYELRREYKNSLEWWEKVRALYHNNEEAIPDVIEKINQLKTKIGGENQ